MVAQGTLVDLQLRQAPGRGPHYGSLPPWQPTLEATHCVAVGSRDAERLAQHRGVQLQALGGGLHRRAEQRGQ